MKLQNRKKISSLNAVFAKAIAQGIAEAPSQFFAEMLREKAQAAGTKISVSTSKFLARWLIESGTGSASWSSAEGNEPDTVILLTADDLETVANKLDEFGRVKIPDIIRDSIDDCSKDILRTLEKDWPSQKDYEATRMEAFRFNLEARWGDAFDILRMMYTISIELGGQIEKRWRRRSKKLATLRYVLLSLHARACQVTAEIICLMENGFADGAMARWRTLHEIRIVTSLIAEHGEELAEMYLAHEVVEAKRAMDKYNAFHVETGAPAVQKREIDAVQRAYANSLKRYGDQFGSEYGWAAKHLNMKKPRFVDLEKSVGHQAMQPYYRMASYNVHAGCKGITFRLSRMRNSRNILIAGASNAGFVDPATNTGQAILEVTGLLFGPKWRFSDMIELKVLISLWNRLPDSLDRAQRRLDRDHRRTVDRTKRAA